MPGFQQRGYGGPPMGYRNQPRYNQYGGGDAELDPDSDQFRKLFIGGLSFDTDENSLRSYFSEWGDIVDCIVMRDSQTKRGDLIIIKLGDNRKANKNGSVANDQSRGFGFITYKTRESVDEVQKKRPHTIDGREVETKRAMPRDDPSAHNQQSVKKMFVGGLKDDTTEDMVKEVFSDFGDIKQVELITDKSTGKIKGFCFITFHDYDSVDKAVLKKRHGLNGRKVEVKKAFSKGEMDLARNMPPGRMMGMGMGMGMGPGPGPMGRGGRGDFNYGGGGYGGQGAYGGGYGYNQGGYGGGYGQGGWQGGYNDYPGYGPGNQGGNASYGGNNFGPGGFNRR